ncbi:MAG: ATP-binding protein [Proteobacteria bacterium]|nr:ATP-binding protein [Pseudomonadota bacterium]
MHRKIGIFHKLAGLIVGLIAALVTLLAIYFPKQQIDSMQRALRIKAATYGRLVSEQVRSAVAFDDVETAREIFAAVLKDRDVISIALFYADGRLLHASGDVSDTAVQAGGTEKFGLVVTEATEVLRVIAPVVSLEGPRGTLTMEVSTSTLEAKRHEITRGALGLGVMALIVGVLMAALIGRSFARRIIAIATVATAVAAGDREQRPVEDHAGDEIGALARAFNAMLAQLRGLIAQIRKQAKRQGERLERLVEQRTHELNARNQDMRLVLDNVDQGFLTTDRNGVVLGERSAIVERWFGTPRTNEFIWHYISRADAKQGQWLEVSWFGLADGVLPVAMSLLQLPDRFQRGDQYFAIAYKPLLDKNEQLDKLLIIISDISAEVESERARAEQRELLELVSSIMEDRQAFLEFFAEAGQQIAALRQHSAELGSLAVKRLLHTLRGNCSLFGAISIAEICREIEGDLSDGGDDVGGTDLQRLWQRWHVVAERIDNLLGARKRSVLEIARDDYDRALHAIADDIPAAQVSCLFRSFKLESTRSRLSRIAEQLQRLAISCGKSPVTVEIADGGLRIDPQEWSQFWSTFVHVLRNAIDHGIETPAEREKLGKLERATITLRTVLDGDSFCIQIADNGRGIDWQAVREKAAYRCLPHESHSELVAALFVDGLSTRDGVSELSGRGVGMSALKAACEARGGVINVASTPGAGTTFTFTWSIHRVTVIDLYRDAPLVAGLYSTQPAPVSSDAAVG